MKIRVATALALALAVNGCGDEIREVTEPAPVTIDTTVVFDAFDPCALRIPSPSDLFRGDDLRMEANACPPPSDPIEAAVDSVIRDEGVPTDAPIRIPVDGSIDATTLTSTLAFTLTGTITVPGAPPPVVFLELTGNATTSEGWSLLPYSASAEAKQILITPAGPLDEGAYYVLVTTDSIRNGEKENMPIAPPPATRFLVGSTPITAGAFEGLDAATAQRLERERRRLSPLVALLARSHPPIPGERITSIQGWSTALGFERMKGAVDAYHEAVRAGRIERTVQVGPELPPAQIYPTGPASRYAQVQGFRRGTILTPRLLDAEGHLRPDWSTSNLQTLEVPFLMSIPKTTARYPVLLLLPGFGRSKLDGREIANDLAGGPRTSVLSIDLPCHGDRSPDASGRCGDARTAEEIAALADVRPNNGNPELVGADGIPDTSGVGFFSGEPRALRDQQIAAAIEAIHVLEVLQDGREFLRLGLTPDPTEIHLAAHGHAAAIGVYATGLANAPPKTLQLPSGGIGIPALVLGGSETLRAAFNDSLPSGINSAMLPAYLERLENSVLQGIAIERGSGLAANRLLRGVTPRILLSHGSAAEFVPIAAREHLKAALVLPPTRMSRHNATCDDFFIYTCSLGDNPAWLQSARMQMGTFVGSGGVTVRPPAQ